MSFFCLEYINYHITSILRPYMNSEVERLTNNVVNKAIREKMSEKRYSFMKENKGLSSVESYSYDTELLIKMKDEITEFVQDVLLQLEDGKIEQYFIPERLQTKRFKNVHHGIICDVSLGSIRGSTIFANIGPTIPIKLSFLGQISSDIDVDIKEYGINNVLVKIILVLNIKEQISMPFSSERVEIIVQEPISIDLLQGDIPYYINGFSK